MRFLTLFVVQLPDFIYIFVYMHIYMQKARIVSGEFVAQTIPEAEGQITTTRSMRKKDSRPFGLEPRPRPSAHALSLSLLAI